MIVSAGAVNAAPTANSIYVDGTKVNGAAYKIEGNNYFKLRDIAAMVNGTDKQFSVTWNNAEKRIDLTTSTPYTTVGGELGAMPAGTQNATLSNAVVYKNGAKAEYTGYNINSNNFYKLRDLCKDMDIGVKYDESAKRVDILTTVGYGEENTATTPEQPTTPTMSDNSSNSNGSDEDYETIVDYRQPGDTGIRSIDLGDGDTIHMYKFYPSYDHYSVQYQNLLDTCGEEIITKNIYYNTYCSQTGEDDSTLYGFPMEVMVVDDRIKPDTWWDVKTIYVSSGLGSFELKMPKSVYEKVLAGDRNVLTVKGTSIEMGGMRTIINGKTYQLNSNRIVASDVRDSKPTRVRFDMSYKRPGT